MFKRYACILVLFFGLGLVSMSAQNLPVGGRSAAGFGRAPAIPTISNLPFPSSQNPYGIQTPLVATNVVRPGTTDLLVHREPIRRNEFQIFVERSVGLQLPMFGQNLFRGAPNTFAPADNHSI